MERQFYAKGTIVVNTMTKRRGRVAWKVSATRTEYVPVVVMDKAGKPIIREWAKAHVQTAA